MYINATLINLYNVCQRELWLHANGIRFEHTSDLVLEGKLIHEDSYPQRSEKYEEIELDGIKVDYYDAKSKVIHEIKKSNKVEKAHEWQVKYYLYVFEQNGIEGVTGLEAMKKDIEKIVSDENCPPLIQKSLCRNCSYFEFCYSKEVEE